MTCFRGCFSVFLKCVLKTPLDYLGIYVLGENIIEHMFLRCYNFIGAACFMGGCLLSTLRPFGIV